jgi:hypothetical protein
VSWLNDNRPWLEAARTAWAPQNPEPLQVRAWLNSDVAYDGHDGITLEGALQSVVIMRMTGRLPDDVFADCPISTPFDESDVQVPIVDSLLGGWNIARASIGWFSPDAAVRVGGDDPS